MPVIKMQKARDPCEMAGLVTVITACALYTLLVRSLQAHHFIRPGGRCAGILGKSELATIAMRFHAKNISQIIEIVLVYMRASRIIKTWEADSDPLTNRRRS